MQVLIIDSSIQIIERLEQLLTEIDGISKCFGATNSTEGLNMFNEIKPDIILLDMNFPDNLSYNLIKQIKGSGQKNCLITLSIHIDNAIQEQCFLLGADFFFDKYFAYDKIPEAIGSIKY
jgi:DNA-binding NarL/FixJ family response regulator